MTFPVPFCWGLFCISWQHTGIFVRQRTTYFHSSLPFFMLAWWNPTRSPGDGCPWPLPVEEKQSSHPDGGHKGWDSRWLENCHRMTKITLLFNSFWKSLCPRGRKTDGDTVKKVVPLSAKHKRMHLDFKPQLWINWQIYLWAYQGHKTIILDGKWKWHCVAHSHLYVNCSWNGC